MWAACAVHEILSLYFWGKFLRRYYEGHGLNGVSSAYFMPQSVFEFEQSSGVTDNLKLRGPCLSYTSMG